MGVNAKKLLDNALKFAELLQEVNIDDEVCQDYSSVWSKLQELMVTVLAYTPTPAQIQEFQHAAVEWGNLFQRAFGAADVTPYIHILCAHVHQFVSKYGSIAKFGNWGAEGLHSEVKFTILHNSPRSGGVANKGPAYYALKTHVLNKILTKHGLIFGQHRKAN